MVKTLRKENLTTLAKLKKNGTSPAFSLLNKSEICLPVHPAPVWHTVSARTVDWARVLPRFSKTSLAGLKILKIVKLVLVDWRHLRIKTG